MEPVSRRQPVLAGILTALVGFTSSFAVVLAGLRAVGASPAQAASGLLAVCATQALGMLWLARRHRIPLTLAWSTPGAALLASTGVVRGGWPAAVGAFLVVGALVIATGLWSRLGGLIAAIPTPIAQAMLAGVVLELCLAPARGLAAHPWEVGPIVATWLVLLRAARKWAVRPDHVRGRGVGPGFPRHRRRLLGPRRRPPGARRAPAATRPAGSGPGAGPVARMAWSARAALSDGGQDGLGGQAAHGPEQVARGLQPRAQVLRRHLGQAGHD
jgi:hypothetical protein